MFAHFHIPCGSWSKPHSRQGQYLCRCPQSMDQLRWPALQFSSQRPYRTPAFDLVETWQDAETCSLIRMDSLETSRVVVAGRCQFFFCELLDNRTCYEGFVLAVLSIQVVNSFLRGIEIHWQHCLGQMVRSSLDKLSSNAKREYWISASDFVGNWSCQLFECFL